MIANSKTRTYGDHRLLRGVNISLMAEIDGITNASEHLEFAKHLIGKHAFDAERRTKLNQQLDRIVKRINAPTLYLTVIGEFSSGKSTFINGLLRQRLLKASRVATTASATYITHGTIFSVSVTFTDGSYIQATELDTAPLHRAIAKMKPELSAQLPLQQLIDLLTSDQEIADRVKHIDIALPEARLESGLAIIDTPGRVGRDMSPYSPPLRTGLDSFPSSGSSLLLLSSFAMNLLVAGFVEMD